MVTDAKYSKREADKPKKEEPKKQEAKKPEPKKVEAKKPEPKPLPANTKTVEQQKADRGPTPVVSAKTQAKIDKAQPVLKKGGTTVLTTTKKEDKKADKPKEKLPLSNIDKLAKKGEKVPGIKPYQEPKGSPNFKDKGSGGHLYTGKGKKFGDFMVRGGGKQPTTKAGKKALDERLTPHQQHVEHAQHQQHVAHLESQGKTFKRGPTSLKYGIPGGGKNKGVGGAPPPPTGKPTGAVTTTIATTPVSPAPATPPPPVPVAPAAPVSNATQGVSRAAAPKFRGTRQNAGGGGNAAGGGDQGIKRVGEKFTGASAGQAENRKGAGRFRFV